MKTLSILFIFSTLLSVNAKISLEGVFDEIQLGDQKVVIAKAEVVVNKMPGEAKHKRYIIVSLESGDKKKIMEEYTVEGISFPGCTRRFSSKKFEKSGDRYTIRNLPDWAVKNTLVVLTVKDSKGKVHKLKDQTTELEVF